jgi:hypothetical protein
MPVKLTTNTITDISDGLPPSLLVRMSESGGAVFDKSERYRYLLWRDLPSGDGTMVLVMLNPNRADESRNDPTIRRCIGFATSWGFGRIEVVNLFAFKAEKPHMLTISKQPVGSYNDAIICQRVRHASLLIVAWGNHGRLHERDSAVLGLLKEYGPAFCLGTTKLGMPRHPLYIRSDVKPLKFDYCSFSSA